MKVESKYKPDDYLWMMVQNKPLQVIVAWVHTSTGMNSSRTDFQTNVKYDMHHGYTGIEENKLFKTREELIASL